MARHLRLVHLALASALVLGAGTVFLATTLVTPARAIEVRGGHVFVQGESRAIVGLSSDTGAMKVVPGDFIEEPDVLETFPRLDTFYARQSRMLAIARGDGARWILDDQSERGITLISREPLSLPIRFFAQAVAAAAIWLIGLWTYAFSDRGAGARAFCASAMGFAIAAASAAVYSTRPLAIDESLFRSLCHLNFIGTVSFGAAVSALLLTFPRPLVRAGRWAAASAVLFFVAHALELAPRPWVSPYNAVLIYVITIITGGVLQWRATRRDPVARASLGWMALSIALGIGLFVVANLLPALLGREALASQSVAILGFVLMYVGVCLGVLKRRLFDLDRWWFRTWTWIAGGTVVVLLDVAIVALSRLDAQSALTVSVLAVGFVYFPARQWLLGWLARREGTEDPWPAQMLIGAQSFSELSQLLEQALKRRFRPLELTIDASRTLDQSAIDATGATLSVPLPRPGDGAFVCNLRDDGRRLFRADDPASADELSTLARAVGRALEARAEGEREERQRIRRDLHDDLGPSLSHIVQSAETETQAQLGQRAMTALHDALSALSPEPAAVETLLVDLEREVRTRASREVVWTVEGHTAAVLSSSQRSSLSRALREGVTNALRHGTGPLHVQCELAPDMLRIIVMNDVNPEAESQHGIGMASMRDRLAAVSGQLHVSEQGGRFTVTIEVPLQEVSR